MLGAILGDTVGSIYEFNNTKDYNFEMFTNRSGYTDDTIMTMAVAYWLLKDPDHKYETLEEAMVMFAKNCPCPNGGFGEMFYVWLFMPWSLKEICPRAFDEDFLPKYNSPDNRVPYNSWGNGSAMRVSAIGWFFDTLEDTERIAKITAEITHNHPEGIKGAQATAAAIWMARNGKSKKEIKEYIESKYEYDLDRTWEYLNQRCGDSDTLACITGGIAEAYYKEIPEYMIESAQRVFPPIFHKILNYMQEQTFYAKR
jgi:ADP-ribosylglycohydrolase